MKLEDLNETQRNAILEYRREQKELTPEEQEFICKNYPIYVTADDIIFTEDVIDYIMECSNNEIDTPTSLVRTLRILIGKIQNGEYVNIPAGASVEIGVDHHCWVGDHEFDIRDIKSLIKKP